MDDKYTKENVLAHYGVLGMHWGKRRSKSTSSSSFKGENSKDHKRTRGLQKKRMSQMSNSELKKVNERLQLETNYKKLTKTKKTLGRKLFDEMILGSVKKTATSYISKQMASAVGLSEPKKKKKG